MKTFVGIIIILIVLGVALTTGTQTEAFRRRHGHRGRGRWRHPRRAYGYGWRPWYYFGGSCKNGCSYIGHNRWGCQYPGSGSNDCWFASDCYWCGSGRWF